MVEGHISLGHRAQGGPLLSWRAKKWITLTQTAMYATLHAPHTMGPKPKDYPINARPGPSLPLSDSALAGILSASSRTRTYRSAMGPSTRKRSPFSLPNAKLPPGRSGPSDGRRSRGLALPSTEETLGFRLSLRSFSGQKSFASHADQESLPPASRGSMGTAADGPACDTSEGESP